VVIGFLKTKIRVGTLKTYSVVSLTVKSTSQLIKNVHGKEGDMGCGAGAYQLLAHDTE
jgi:hypothetical protein